MTPLSRSAQALTWLQQRSLATRAEWHAAGFSLSQLQWLHRQGKVERVARGLYAVAGAVLAGEHQSLVEACRRSPRGVVCLLSALAWHGIGSELPSQVWLAVPVGSKCPKDLPVTIVQVQVWALNEEVEEHQLAAGSIRVTSLARTLVECFKYRSKVGLEPALEALREALQLKKVTRAQLFRLATRFRMASIMRPYLEAMS